MISFFKKSSTDYYIINHSKKLSLNHINKLCWLFGNAKILKSSSLKGKFIGPRKEMTTPWSTNAVEIASNIGIDSIIRIERFYKNSIFRKSRFDNLGQNLQYMFFSLIAND